jgi:Ca2+-binding EF-hand superfamily protein
MSSQAALAPAPAAAAAAAPSSPAPKSPNAAAAPKAQLGATVKVPLPVAGKPDVKALPIEEKAVVFKGAARSKAIFKTLDADRDKFLSRAEFTEGLLEFMSTPELVLTQEQISALWAETDLNKDDKVSWAEFNYRFCGGPHPSTLEKKVEKRPTLLLQTPRRKKDAPVGKAASAVAELQLVLEALYDGTKPRYPGVDLSKARALNSAGLKKLINQTLTEEKNEAKDQKRPLEDWAQACTISGSTNDSKACDRLFAQLDTGKTGKVDLQPLFEQLKLRPSMKDGGGAAKAARKAKSGARSTGPQGQRNGIPVSACGVLHVAHVMSCCMRMCSLRVDLREVRERSGLGI